MINVTKTHLPSLEKYKAYLDSIYKTSVVTNNGELVRKLERDLEAYLGVKNILLVSNGTLALQIAYKLLGLKGDVLTTPFSFVATVSSQVWEGLNPIFVDIDKDTFNLDSSLIKKNITPETSAIIPVHVFGNRCDVNKIDQIAKEANIKVIYDAAHAFGVTYNGQSVLNYGDISTLSFHATKIFHTIEGGAIVINDDSLYEKAKLMINFGINGPDNILSLGINAKMNEFQAAMGLCMLDDINMLISKRKAVYEFYRNSLSESLTLQKHNENSTLNYGYFPVVFDCETTLLRVKNNLENEDIYPRRYFYPSLSTLSYIKNINKVPVAESIAKRILCLPIYDSLDLKQTKLIIDIIHNNLNR